MTKIEQVLLNKSDSIYRVYVFKIRIRGKFKYVVGSCIGRTIDELQRLLLVLHKTLGHLPQAKVLVADKVAPDSLIAFYIQEEELLYKSRYFFSKEFSTTAELFDINENTLLAIYYNYVPDTRGLVIGEMMPSWSYSEAEMRAIKNSSVEVNDNYCLTKA